MNQGPAAVSEMLIFISICTEKELSEELMAIVPQSEFKTPVGYLVVGV
jgi:hypothetical protein